MLHLRVTSARLLKTAAYLVSTDRRHPDEWQRAEDVSATEMIFALKIAFSNFLEKNKTGRGQHVDHTQFADRLQSFEPLRD